MVLSLQERSHRFKYCHTKVLYLLLMRGTEVKVLRALIFITIFVFLYQLSFSIFTPLVASLDSLNNFKFYGFITTFLGLHAFFALCTFIFSRISNNNKLSFVPLCASVFAPVIYLIMNNGYLTALNISPTLVILFLVLIFDFIKKSKYSKIIKKYIDVLINHFYLDDEIY